MTHKSLPLTRRVISSLSCVALAISTVTASTPPRPHGAVAERTQAASLPPTAKVANLPLAFEDRGPQTGYFAHAGAFDLALTPTATVVSAHDGTSLRLELVRANRKAKLTGIDRLPGVVNYLVGRNKTNWRTNVPTYGGVLCKGAYSGIDATYRGEDGNLVWDFVVAPHVDPRAIAIDVSGARELTIADDGALVAATPTGEFREDAPVVYQQTADGRVTVTSHYVLRGPHTFGFEIGSYDTSRPLVIDPTVRFNFPIGGNGHTFAFAVALDTQGNTYLVGSTAATDLPTLGAIDTTLGGDRDAFVAKLNNSGALVYSTYLGGSRYDSSQAVAVDAAGEVCLTGQTGFSDTNDFPVTPGAFQTQFGGAADAFVAKLAADGASLVYATYLGGAASYDTGTGIAVDATGRVYVCGATSQNFPTANALQPQPAGSAEGFLARINPTGSMLEFSTYLGGHGDDVCTSLSLLDTGQCAMAGYTTSTDLPTRNPVQAHIGGLTDAFVAVCDTDGSQLTFCTYLGGSQNDTAYGCAADPAGHVYCAGNTYSVDFPVKNPIDTSHCGESADACPDAFVCEMDPSTSTVDYSTYLGGSGIDGCNAIAVDQGGTVLCTGNTTSADFPDVDPLSGDSGGKGGAFITRIVPGGSAIDFSSVFGRPDGDVAFSIAVNGTGTKAAVAFTGGLTLEVGGALGIDFAPRKMADVVARPSIVVQENPDGTAMALLYCIFGNDGPDPAEGVQFEINAPCTHFVEYSPDSRITITNLPEPGEEVLHATAMLNGPLARNSEILLRIVVLVGADDLVCLGQSAITCRAQVSTNSFDPHLTNNERSVSAFVEPLASASALNWTEAQAPLGPPTGLQLFTIANGPQKSTGTGIGHFDTSRDPSNARRRMPLRGIAGSSGLTGYRVYASQQPNVQPIPGNLFTTTPPSQTGADVSGAPAGSYFVVTSVYGDGTESGSSNEVGGTLPTVSNVVVSAKKVTATGSGFPAGEAVYFGGVPFTTAAKLKKNNTKLVQKGATVIGQTPTQILQGVPSGSSLVIVFVDLNGNGVGYVYTR